MAKLLKELAEWHYEKAVALHYFKYLTLAQKASIFFHDLEHDILRKITGKHEFFEQWNWIKDKQGNKEGLVPPTLVSDIHSFKPWRNEAIHKASPEIDIVTYLKLFQTFVQTIKYFSDVPWTNDINNILNNYKNETIENKKGGRKGITGRTSKSNDSNIRDWKKEIKLKFIKYMKKRFPKNSDSFIETNFNDAFYLINDGKEAGMDFEQIIFENKIPNNFVEKLEKDLINREKNKSRAKYYKISLSYLLDFLDENQDLKYKQ